MEEKIHLKGFNGIRGIGVVSVVLTHVSIPGFTLSYLLPFGLAEYAVTHFFALSGFLITYLLFVENGRTGRISIRNFYIRRMLRIWPLYFTYIAAVIITLLIYDRSKLPGSLPWYLFFAANIPTLTHTFLPYLSHYWTLGVEEQFYIFWPWVIRNSKNVLKALIIFTICFFLIRLICRFIYFEWVDIDPLRVISNIRFECMSLVGIAALLCLNRNTVFLRIVTHRITEIICWLFFLAMIANKYNISPFLNHDIAALVGIGLIVNLGFNKKPLISLENRLLDLLGRLSYGMYIIHPLVIFYYFSLLNRFPLNDVAKTTLFYAGSLLLTFLLAWLIYEFFEKKFLRLKDRFTTVKNSDSKYG